MLVAFFLNIGGALLRRGQLETMAELAAMGGGRVVAEAIARRAADNYLREHPEAVGRAEAIPVAIRARPQAYLTAPDWEALQGEAARVQVEAAARHYLERNRPRQLDLNQVRIRYPVAVNRCDGAKRSAYGNNQTVEVIVELTILHPLLFEALLERLDSDKNLTLAATGVYIVPLCPGS